MNTHQSSVASTTNSSSMGTTNGSKKRRFLAAHGATKAIPRFGSQSVITTVVDNDCRVDVVEEIFPLVEERLRRQGRETETVTLDRLEVSTLVKNVVVEVADLCQPGADIDESKAAQETVLAAKQGRGTEVVSRIREAIAKVVEPEVEGVRQRIRSLADNSPDRLCEIGDDTLRLLRRAKPLFVDSAPSIQRGSELLMRAAEVVDRANEFAADDRQEIVGTIKDLARDSVRNAFEALVHELVLKYLLAKWSTLTDAAEALLHLEGDLIGQLDALSRECARWVNTQRETLANPPCNTTLCLAGTSAEEAIAGILKRHRFAGRGDLVAHIVERTVKCLRDALMEHAQQGFATQPAAQILASVPVEQAFATVRDVLYDELEPEIQSVYGRLKRRGVGHVLQTLLQRSRLTSDPGPRACTRFKLNAYRVVIVSLPELTQPRDREVWEVIARALEEKTVIVTQHPATFDEIVVHRVGGGWPWQVLPSNSHFCEQYVESAETDHRPHLPQVLPESPRGKINPIYPTAANERSDHGKV